MFLDKPELKTVKTHILMRKRTWDLSSDFSTFGPPLCTIFLSTTTLNSANRTPFLNGDNMEVKPYVAIKWICNRSIK